MLFDVVKGRRDAERIKKRAVLGYINSAGICRFIDDHKVVNKRAVLSGEVFD
jgi:hypothetical protein